MKKDKSSLTKDELQKELKRESSALERLKRKIKINAEEQARKAKIEASLERVRSKAMAMHTSEELSSTVNTFFKELKILGIIPIRCGVGEMHEEEKTSDITLTTARQQGDTYRVLGKVKHIGHPVMEGVFENWKAQKEYYPVLRGRELKDYYKVLSANLNIDLNINSENRREEYGYWIMFPEGMIFAWTEKKLSDKELTIFRRFTSVLSLTYKRYNDLKQSEAQAREAQIEAALERVRSRTIGMQKSEELREAIQVIYEQLIQLNFNIDSAGFAMDYRENDDFNIWVADPKDEYPAKLHIPYFEHPLFNRLKKAKEKGLDFITISLTFEEKNKYWDHSFKTLSEIPKEFKEAVYSSPGLATSNVLLKNVGLYIFNLAGIPYSDTENATLMRFAKVFEQTYTRFLDLQKAEKQARESKIEAALERVRSRTLAMQKSDELAETSAVLFQQLIGLGIEPNRLYIGIIKDDNGHIEFWVTDEDGSKISTQFTGDTNRNSSMKKMYDAWKVEKKSLTINMHGKELENYFHYLAEELNVPFKQGLSQKRRIQSIAFFGKGFIGIASPDEQPEETINLLERFAAVFNLTYTRFNDLQIAEHHAEQAELDLIKLKEEKKRTEDALNELRATQKQLIQSEKMASLGELTAGIAHEIQNPLNFVNNFSEVNAELIEEMQEEMDNGNLDDAKAISNDIKENEQKINHHGKRADAIVKGMLQHSRSSSGVKEPTDINALADEYLRLAYHGLRAKDKSFNTAIKTDFDETLEKVNIIPQDIGRVLLNLYNNAFYATNEKQKLNIENYEPTVLVSTKKISNKIILTVKDNGNGIPQKVVDKIFQPFFTTKPTGQGTGLGLSLSYDIIKSHGGEIKVNTIEGEFTEFVIQLPV